MIGSTTHPVTGDQVHVYSTTILKQYCDMYTPSTCTVRPGMIGSFILLILRLVQIPDIPYDEVMIGLWYDVVMISGL